MFPTIPIRSQDSTSTRGASPNIWGDCPVKGLYDQSSTYGTMFDDFRRFTADTAGWGKYADTGGTITMLASSSTGVVDVATDSTDNDEVYLTTGGNVAPFGALTTGKKFWLEARLAAHAVTAHNTFFGLTAVAAAADNFIGDTGTVSVTNLLGFVIAEGTPTRLDYIYNKTAGSVQTATTGTTIAADTYVKVGIKSDGTTVRWYVNGAEVFSASQTATNMPASGTLLQLTMGVKNGGAAAQSLYVDWVALVMEG